MTDINPALQMMAEQLGVASEYLWGVLVGHAPIAGITALAVQITLVTVTTVTFKWLKKSTEEDVLDDDRINGMWFLWGIWALLTAVVILATIDVVISGIVSPEYWALQQVLGVIK